MKTTMIAVSLLIVSAFSMSANAQTIAGGIVYSDGKDAVYQDYKTGKEKIDLTADLNAPAIKGPLAASADGKTLIWLEGNKLLARQLPDGKPYPYVIKGKFLPVAGNIKNLALSPNGGTLGWESTEKAACLILSEAAGKNKATGAGYNTYAKYIPGVDKYDAISVMNADQEWAWRCGNTAFYPKSSPWRTEGTVDYDPKKVHRVGEIAESIQTYRTPPDICPGLFVTVADAQKMFGAKRDAYFLAWHKTGNRYAVIYKTDKTWGPIEIREARFVDTDHYLKEIPRPQVWQIPVSLKDCRGLAFKPDGSLTYLSGQTVYSLDGKTIEAGIKSSGIGPDNLQKGGFVPIKYVFDVKPEVVAEDINGDRLYWTANDTFLFRENHGSLLSISSWYQGKVKGICDAPSEYSYCDQLSQVSTKTDGAKDKNKVAENLLIPSATIITSGKGRVAAAGSNNKNGKDQGFSVGVIQTSWHSMTDKSVGIWTGEWDKQGALEFAFPTETSLEDINNPARYEFKKGTPKAITTPNGGTCPPVTDFSLNQIIILKSGNNYAAIKPLAVERKYSSFAEMPKEMQESWKEFKDKGPPPIYEWMTYEWKFWPENVKIADSARNKNESAAKSSLPTSGTSTTSEKQLVAGDIKVSWIKDVWGHQDGKEVIGVGFETLPSADGKKPDLYSLSAGSKLLESITDPSKYTYDHSHGIGIQLGWVVFLRAGDKYAAFKPIELKADGSLVYEWKYWPVYPTAPDKPILQAANTPPQK